MAHLHQLVNPQLLAVGLGIAVVAYAIRLSISYKNAIATVNHLPGYRSFFSHRSNVLALLPKWKYLTGYEAIDYRNKHERRPLIHSDTVEVADRGKRAGFEEVGLDIISLAAVWPIAGPTLLLADPDAIKVTQRCSRIMCP
jgi:hypothetical protein